MAQSPHILFNKEYRYLLKNELVASGGNDRIFSSIGHQNQTEVTGVLYNILQENLNEIRQNNIVELIQDFDEIKISQEISSSRKQYVDSVNLFYTYENDSYIEVADIYTEQPPLLKYFYKNRSHFLSFDNENFSLRINPVIDLRYGSDNQTNDKLFQNTRGIKVRGFIDNKVYFYTSIFENQARYNNYVHQYIDKFRTIPSNGAYKPYESSVIDDLVGVDYHNAQAYVGLPISKHINVEFGHGKHFIGDGYRSLLLSDFAQNYFYLRFNTKIWKFNYQNLFVELNPISALINSSDKLLPKKYMASHYLSYKPHKRVELGLYEAVTFSREDHFEFNYLNPIILYRSVEQFLDSPDNVLIGINASWIPINGIQLYGQFLLDEFKLGELKDGNGWWANKYALQIGTYLANPFEVQNLGVRFEYNMVRPYTYTHNTGLDEFENYATASYSHFNQSLTHPLGANFREILIDIRYQPFSKLQINGSLFFMQQGEDTDDEFWGANILVPNRNRVMDYNNELLQGIESTTTLLSFNTSYEFFRNYYLDFELVLRDKNSDDNNRDLQTQYIGGGIRINVDKNSFDF